LIRTETILSCRAIRIFLCKYCTSLQYSTNILIGCAQCCQNSPYFPGVSVMCDLLLLLLSSNKRDEAMTIKNSFKSSGHFTNFFTLSKMIFVFVIYL
jgi:hypothetical protein